MPEIPLTQRPDLIRTAPVGRFIGGNGFQSAPISAREYISPGDGVNALGRGTAVALDAGAEFFRKAQEATDYVSAQEAHRFARNQIDAFHTELQSRTDYENFEKDYQDKLKAVEEGVQPLLEKASERGKMVFGQQLSDLTEGAAIKTRAISMQRRVTNDREALNSVIDDYIEKGNPEGARIEKKKGIKLGLFHPAESEKIDRRINAKTEFNGIAKSIQSGSAKIESEKLMERNKDGSYVNYPHIHENDRLNLKRVADNVTAANENQAHDYLRHNLMTGTLTEKMIDDMPVTQKAKDNFKEDLKQRNESIRKNELENQKAVWDETSTDISMQIYDAKFSGDKDERERQKAEILNTINEKKLPTKTRLELFKQLDSKFKTPKEAENKGLVYEAIKKKIKETYDAGFKDGNVVPGSGFAVRTIDSPFYKWKNDEYATPEQQFGAYVRLAQAWEDTYRDNPKMSPEQATQWFDQNFAQIIEPKVITNLQAEFSPKNGKPDTSFAVNLSTPSTQSNPSGEIVQDINGKAAVFDAQTKKFKRWK